MDKTIVKRSKGSQILEIIVGAGATAASVAIIYLVLTGQLTADLALWGSGMIVASALGGLLIYILAAIAGATKGY
ncbi:MAG TPA: hypothetical protein VMK31_02655 [Sphingomicrobium sp.]|nr:hypothetical protein [Sphingomicrobium sp.]